MTPKISSEMAHHCSYFSTKVEYGSNKIQIGFVDPVKYKQVHMELLKTLTPTLSGHSMVPVDMTQSNIWDSCLSKQMVGFLTQDHQD